MFIKRKRHQHSKRKRTSRVKNPAFVVQNIRSTKRDNKNNKRRIDQTKRK